jgi:hypothetical protein
MDENTEAVVQTPADAGTAPEPKPAPKYNDDDVNAIVAGKTKAATEKARAELMASLGLKDASEIEALKKAREAQMTEAEKLKAELDAIKGADAESKKEAQAIKAENAALKKGVPADKVERVKKLVASGAYEGDTVDAMVDAVLAEFPEYAKGSTSIGGPVKNQSIDDDAAMMAKLEEMRNRK